jgi:hypothetical protein
MPQTPKRHRASRMPGATAFDPTLTFCLPAALVTLGLGYAVSDTGRRRRDARLFLISLAFIASCGFLAAACARDTRRAARQERRLRTRHCGGPGRCERVRRGLPMLRRLWHLTHGCAGCRFTSSGLIEERG